MGYDKVISITKSSLSPKPRIANPLDQFETISTADLYTRIWQVALKSKLKAACEMPDAACEFMFYPLDRETPLPFPDSWQMSYHVN